MDAEEIGKVIHGLPATSPVKRMERKKGAAKADLKQTKSTKSSIGRQAAHELEEMPPAAKYICAQVASLLQLDPAAVTTQIAENGDIQKMERLLAADDTNILVFFHQAPAGVEPATAESEERPPRRVFVANPGEDALAGTCVYAIKTTAKALTTSNISSETFFGTLTLGPAPGKGGLLKAMARVVDAIIQPTLRANTNWGKMVKTDPSKDGLLLSLEKFSMSLMQANMAVDATISLADLEPGGSIPGFKIAKLTGPKQVQDAAKNRDVVVAVETLVESWSDQMSRVLAVNQQIRSEDDEAGPRVELAHWKQRTAVFNALAEEIRKPEVTNAITVLQLAKSKHLPRWRFLDTQLTEKANEAKDNVKFLGTLGTIVECLYHNEGLDSIHKGLATVMHTIGMIHTVSQYYNTSEHMTALLIKVTNQVITACRDIIYEKEPRIWEQPDSERATVLTKVKEVHKMYYESFIEEKARLAEHPERNQFNFPAMGVFGKSDKFVQRIKMVEEMLATIKTWSKLESVQMDGIEPLVINFKAMVKNIKQKGTDPLDIRQESFDSDYETFYVGMANIEALLQQFCDSQLESQTNVLRLTQLLAKCERVAFLGVDLSSHYNQSVVLLNAELQAVKQLYMSDRSDPAIARNTPPLAGRIMWARNLFARIEEPMMILQQLKPAIFETADAKRLIKQYNKIGRVLTEFEIVCHNAWKEAVDVTISGLRSTILVIDPNANETSEGKFVVNLDQQVMQLVAESKMMVKLQLEMNSSAELLTNRGPILKDKSTQLEKMLQSFVDMQKSIPETLLSIMMPSIQTVTNSLDPGLGSLNWLSVTLDEYMDTVSTAIEHFGVHLNRVLAIVKVRIDQLLKKIKFTPLCALPTDGELWTVAEFEAQVQAQAAQEAVRLESYSQQLELAVEEVVDTIAREIDMSDWDVHQRSLHTEREADLKLVYVSALTHMVARSVRRSLDLLKRRASKHRSFTSTAANPKGRHEGAIIKVAVALVDSKVVVTPSLETVQQAVSRAGQCVIGVAKSVLLWNQDRTQDPATLKNHYEQTHNNKEVARLIDGIGTTIAASRTSVFDQLDIFSEYKALWEGNVETTMVEFAQKNPDLSDFTEAIAAYEEMDVAIDNIQASMEVGAVVLDATGFKSMLHGHTASWKSEYAKLLNVETVRDMEEVYDFAEDLTKRLGRDIKDLEDVRLAMTALKDLRDNEIRLDALLGPIEASYKMLEKFNVKVAAAEQEQLDSMHFTWEKMRKAAADKSTLLVTIQPDFKDSLSNGVKQFNLDQKEFLSDYNIKGPMCDGITPAEASDRLSVFQTRFDALWKRYVTYSGGEELFGLPQSEYTDLTAKKKELTFLQKLYSLYNDVIKCVNGYYDVKWNEVDVTFIDTQLNDLKARTKKLPKALQSWDAFMELQKKIDDFSESLPILTAMANPSMLPRHWKRISDTCNGYAFDVYNETFELRGVMEAPILENKEEIEDICIASVKEQDIEAKLNQVMGEWKNHELTFTVFKARGELLINAADISELVVLMEDSLMILSSLMSNRYNPPYKADIQKWVRNLSDSTEIVEKWLVVQNLWVYLEAVFVGGDIAKQLPKEAKRFSNIDKSWVKLMGRAHENLNLVKCCTADETMANVLPHLLEQLEVCQKSLTGYLEKKRLVFPRFFFVSDPVLLEILGQASDPQTIQDHLQSLFDNVTSVTFHEKERDKILAYHSKEGETVTMTKPVKAQGNVEEWLCVLLSMQRSSLNEVISDAGAGVLHDKMDLIPYMDRYPSQVGILGVQLLWTRDAEVALTNSKSDKKAMGKADDYFQEILAGLIDNTLNDLTKLARRKYETLVTLHVHQRDIFHEDIVGKKVRSPQDFEWSKQARFYFDFEKSSLSIVITDWVCKYCLEFIGCVERLCVTPLTDRCYITIAQSMLMSMGAAPAGPAGTGKTETTKDMGRALGKYVVVFNCSDQMDFRGLGRIYKGLAQSGSWGCFDEFNRIELPVLSVAAQQIRIVLQAKLQRKAHFIFMDGDDVTLDPEFGLFLTMNPGYAGRQELPENLKIQFRNVAMMVPDRQIIIRVKLASCGFQDNRVLARKFFTLYKLCEEQLTKQVHYDFGLRNILSVVRTLGAAKRQNPDDSEMTVVMRVLRDMNLSKMVSQDEPLFLSLIGDLFPGIVLDTAGYPELEAAIEAEVVSAKLVNHPEWNLKLIQLFETQRVRHGFMVLGPSGAGKTKNINTLMRSMTSTGTPHKEMRMNPKAITAPQMFGRLDVATNDWTDGIFSTLWRRTRKGKRGEKIWIVLDGPVDAVWIENLNSVLDDNKLLTLANGDRIPMSPDAKLVFEPHNIDNASPATVSRNGMVFMSSTGLPWNPILESWLKSRPPTEQDSLRTSFIATWESALVYTVNSLGPKIPLLECNYIAQALNLLTGMIPSEDNPSPEHLHHLYLFALMWSLGAVLELDDRARLQEFLQVHESNPSLPKLTNSNDSIFDYLVSANGTWIHWLTKVEKYNYAADSIPVYTDILVPNVDNVRTDFLLDTIAKQGKSVLMIGEAGTAKTVIVKGYCSKYNAEEHLFKSFNFSSTSTPEGFQRTIESYVDKRMGSTYGPPAGRKMTVFIDDINMPLINEWKDQIANEIVRQTMGVDGFYSLDKPGDFTTLADMQYMAAMPQPGGGRNDIPERLKRQFAIFNCTLPSNQSIDLIFSTIGLGYFCPERGFSEEVIDVVGRLVPITRRLWQDVKVKMLPTPAKFHYVFNLRDISRIWQGILNIKANECPDAKMMVALWKHECTRVISDRFTELKDVKWFNGRVAHVIAGGPGEEGLKEELVETVPAEPLFADFMRAAPEITGDEEEGADLEAPKIYEWTSLDMLEAKLKEYQELYNETVRGSGLDLVFFKDCIVHIIRVSRIIRLNQGNALLVGVGGSGKQSVTRLASAVARYSVFQITLTRSYKASDLLENMKGLYLTAGAKGQGVTFILTDNEIKSEDFLEFINNILATGEIGGLFPRDEIDEICNDLISIMKKEFPRRPPTAEALYAYFISRVRQNLHVVLCFSPVGEKFRQRARKFPAVFSGCTMDWFMSWPKDALIAVADHFLGSYEMSCTPEIKTAIIETMGIVQDGVGKATGDYFNQYRRQTFVTPSSYLSFLNSYRELYAVKKGDIDVLADQMSTGLSKLAEAGESVDELSKELAVKTVDLAKANKETEAVLVTVTAKSEAAEKVKASVQVVKDRAQAIVDAIDKDKVVAEAKLAAAVPALAAAEAALATITAKDIATVKKLGKPPHLVKRIMDVVLILFGRPLDPVIMDEDEKECPNPTWKEALKTMNGPLLSELVNFNKDTINEEMCEHLFVYMGMEDYNFDQAKKSCSDVAGLAAWTEAMHTFFFINKEVLPLKAGLAIAEGQLTVATAELNAAQAILDEKQAELDVVQAQFEEVMAKKKALQEDADTCTRKMAAATALIDGLMGEKVRWTKQSKEFAEQIRCLVGDVLIMCAFMSYSGPFNASFRLKLLDSWHEQLNLAGIPKKKGLNVISELVDNVTAGEWALQGLPVDDLSLENGIITTKATRFPLMIDPQGQGKSWIKNRESPNGLVVTSLDHKYFRTFLEDSLGNGAPLLIEDIGEQLDPCLDNVLAKNFIKSGSTFKVKVGDKECDVLDGFRLYMTTKRANPAYTPEVFAATSIIDFTVTMKGLEDQLLARVILSEKAELEEERTALSAEVQANKKKMKELEDNLLYKLVNTKGSLVDDESLIVTLRTTKTTSEEVNEKLEIAEATNEKISTAREEYRPVAIRGSIVYFLITDMSKVNSMYQTSLDQFLVVFNKSMADSQPSPVPAKRIVNIINFLTYEAFAYTIRGLYTRDKFLLTILLAIKIDIRKGVVKPAEFQTLIKGGAALDLNSVEPKPKSWILDATWLNLVQLSTLPPFADITNQITRNDKAWKTWFDDAEPEEGVIPDGYDKYQNMGKLLLIRSWCPDRTLAQARKYITDSIGARYVEAVLTDLKQIWAESDTRTPMICLLSPGSDPTAAIQGLAKESKLNCRDISMGQGQEIHARKLVALFQETGGWVLLQNCHLCLDFLGELMDTVTTTKEVHDGFRLWITTEEHPLFPINVLQSSIKFTNEPPQGLKAGIKRTFTGISQERLDISSMAQWKPMLFGVAFLHSVVQERRKYGPLGWNIPYEFNQGDLDASIQMVQNHVDDMDPKKGVVWTAVCYHLGEVQYGGRVTDDRDKRLLNTYARSWFSDEMLQPGYQFYKGYDMANYLKLEQYNEFIEEMPLVDKPGVFGLHGNADIAYQTQVAQATLTNILDIQPKESSSSDGGESREEAVTRMCNDFLQKLPDDFVQHEYVARLKKMGINTSMNIFLRQEIERMQIVVSLVRSTLENLILAIDGTIIMSDQLRDALDKMYDARVPTAWAAISWLSGSLGFWFTELLLRFEQFHAWCFLGRPNSFWLTGFFNANGFITAMRQEITRGHKGWALDSVVQANEVTKIQTREDVSSPPKEGVYVYGLFLDGAGWNKRENMLCEQQAKVLYVGLPILHLFAVNTTGGRDVRQYECPIYRKPRRTDLEYVCMVDLKTKVEPDHWTLRGVALLCDTK